MDDLDVQLRAYLDEAAPPVGLDDVALGVTSRRRARFGRTGVVLGLVAAATLVIVAAIALRSTGDHEEPVDSVPPAPVTTVLDSIVTEAGALVYISNAEPEPFAVVLRTRDGMERTVLPSRPGAGFLVSASPEPGVLAITERSAEGGRVLIGHLTSTGFEIDREVPADTPSEVVWSPDGTAFAYTSRVDIGNEDGPITPDALVLNVADTRTGEQLGFFDLSTYVLEPDFACGPNLVPTGAGPVLWRPDGQVIIGEIGVADCEVSFADMISFDLGSGAIAEVLDGGIETRPLSFSPDGRQLSYEGDGGFVTDANGGEPHRIAGTFVVWSPTNEVAAWLVREPEGDGSIVTVRLGRIGPAGEVELVADVSERGASPARWAPDGSALAVVGESGLTVLDPGGRVLDRFDPGGDVIDFALLPSEDVRPVLGDGPGEAELSAAARLDAELQSANDAEGVNAMATDRCRAPLPLSDEFVGVLNTFSAMVGEVGTVSVEIDGLVGYSTVTYEGTIHGMERRWVVEDGAWRNDSCSTTG